MRHVSILGDSISTFEGCNPDGFAVFYDNERCQQTGVRSPRDTWWSQVIEHLGGQLLANSSFSGSLVEGAGFPAGSSRERIDALSRGGVRPDDIIVFMGINDYGWGGAAAQAAGRGNALPAVIDLDAVAPRTAACAAPDAVARFKAAYDLLLARMCAAYPDASVCCCTLCPGRVAGSPTPTFAFNLRGAPFDDYNDAIRASAREHGCRILDLRAFGVDYEALEGTHPTARGMRQLAHLMTRALDGDATGEAALAPELFDASLRSHKRCPEPSCIGCEHARSTGNQWLLVCDRPFEENGATHGAVRCH